MIFCFCILFGLTIYLNSWYFINIYTSFCQLFDISSLVGIWYFLRQKVMLALEWFGQKGKIMRLSIQIKWLCVRQGKWVAIDRGNIIKWLCVRQRRWVAITKTGHGHMFILMKFSSWLANTASDQHFIKMNSNEADDETSWQWWHIHQQNLLRPLWINRLCVRLGEWAAITDLEIWSFCWNFDHCLHQPVMKI